MINAITYNNTTNRVKKYNDFEYLSQKIRFNDYVSNKTNIVHEKLYLSALNKYLEEKTNTIGITIEEYSKTHIFTEIKNTEYWKPSKVFIKETVYPFKIEKIDLKKYWDNYQYIDEHKNFDSIFFDSDIDINGLEVVNIDYIHGKVKFKNKYSGKEYWKDFKYINEDTVYNNSYFGLNDTFTYKLQNKIYGK